MFLNRKGQEITVVRFTVNEDGSVSNFNTLSYGIVGRVRVSPKVLAQWQREVYNMIQGHVFLVLLLMLIGATVP